jgi:hypothetical protein
MNDLARLAMLCLAAVSCSAGLPGGLDVVTTDSAGVTIVSAESLDGLPVLSLGTPLVELAFSQDSANASFSRVSAVLRLADGRLVIADGAARRLKMFGPDATYLQTLTGPDGAPAEFSAITAIWPAGSNGIAVLDQRKQRVTTLSLDGGELQTADLSAPGLRARAVGRLDTGDVMVRNLIIDVPETGFELSHVAVTRFGTDGTLVDTVGIWPSARMGRLGEPPLQLVSGPMFEPRLVTAAGGNRLLVSECRSAEYRVIDPVRGLIRVVRWPAPDLTVTEDDVASYRNLRLEGLPPERQRRTRAMLDGLPINPNLPACDQLRIDSDGRTWVRSFVRPGASRQQWLVFDADGRPLFSVEMPVAARIMHPGARHVTVIETDSLNVPRIRVYEFE